MSIKSFIIVILSFLASVHVNDARLGAFIVGGIRGSVPLVEKDSSSRRYLAWVNDMVESFGFGTSLYHSISDAQSLGATNYDAAVGNPLKGLLTSPLWVGGNVPDNVPSTLEFYYIGLDEIMTSWNQFNWTVLENTLRDAAIRKKHVIWRIFCHYPGQKLRVPKFLLDAGIELVPLADGGVSPQYDDPTLLRAMEQFITAFGERYDGHRSLAFIQLGLLGKWGEWHTYPDSGLLSEATEDRVVAWYAKAFTKTQMQVRTPRQSAFSSGVGLHDDSFAYSTLDGAANGGQNVGWFFWPKVKAIGVTSFWRKGVMGGETRPELQKSVFQPGYAAGSPFRQDFLACVRTTHASYLLHNAAFANGGFSGIELENALYAHARMGYNFRVNQVEASEANSNQLSIRVRVEQIGVAPFYYPLALGLSCDGYKGFAEGVEQLVDEGESSWFVFHNVPTNSECLQALEVSLASDFLYTDRPIKFAQGMDGRVTFSLPQPDPSTPIPSSPQLTATPTQSPAAAPTFPPSGSPTTDPTSSPTGFPTFAPTSSPEFVPTTTSSPSARPSTSVQTSKPSPSPTESPSSTPVNAPASVVTPSSFWEILLEWIRASMSLN